MSSMCGTSSNGVPASGGSALSCRWVTPTTSPIARCAEQQRGGPPGRGPAAVVVDRDADPGRLRVGEDLWQPHQVVAREGQRLLGEHVLAGFDGGLYPGEPALGAGGQVDVPHRGVGQQLLGAGVDATDEREACRAPWRSWPPSGSTRRSRPTPYCSYAGRCADWAIVPQPRIATPLRSAGKRGRCRGRSVTRSRRRPRGSAAPPAGSPGRRGRGVRRPSATSAASTTSVTSEAGRRPGRVGPGP